MNTNTQPHPTKSSRTFTRHDLDSVIPAVVRRVHAAEFSSQAAIARSYSVDKATATRWMQRALDMGLTDSDAWKRGLLLGRVRQELSR